MIACSNVIEPYHKFAVVPTQSSPYSRKRIVPTYVFLSQEGQAILASLRNYYCFKNEFSRLRREYIIVNITNNGTPTTKGSVCNWLISSKNNSTKMCLFFASVVGSLPRSLQTLSLGTSLTFTQLNVPFRVTVDNLPNFVLHIIRSP